MTDRLTKYIMKPQITDKQGFTLIELLVAITMFGVVATIVYSSLNAILSRTNAIARASDSFEMAKNCMERMTFDLTGIYVEPFPLYSPPGFSGPDDPYRFLAKIDLAGGNRFSTLRFTSTEHLGLSGFADSRLAEIRYYVTASDDPDQGYLLRRADTAFPYDIDQNAQLSDNDPIMCTNIVALEFTFYDAEEKTEEDWDSDSDFYKNTTPVAVGIHLELASGNNTRSFYTRVPLPVFRMAKKEGK
ncbi:MAG: prepilin-type N-terminal cleavage/methylation domain-containing protein [Deltaproteobacteria bacterium]|nr:prepilin-type N-terminal cleavage/methylation domain-containing protein [Deltaproteobacteria bacterium]